MAQACPAESTLDPLPCPPPTHTHTAETLPLLGRTTHPPTTTTLTAHSATAAAAAVPPLQVDTEQQQKWRALTEAWGGLLQELSSASQGLEATLRRGEAGEGLCLGVAPASHGPLPPPIGAPWLAHLPSMFPLWSP